MYFGFIGAKLEDNYYKTAQTTIWQKIYCKRDVLIFFYLLLKAILVTQFTFMMIAKTSSMLSHDSDPIIVSLLLTNTFTLSQKTDVATGFTEAKSKVLLTVSDIDGLAPWWALISDIERVGVPGC